MIIFNLKIGSRIASSSHLSFFSHTTENIFVGVLWRALGHIWDTCDLQIIINHFMLLWWFAFAIAFYGFKCSSVFSRILNAIKFRLKKNMDRFEVFNDFNRTSMPISGHFTDHFLCFGRIIFDHLIELFPHSKATIISSIFVSFHSNYWEFAKLPIINILNVLAVRLDYWGKTKLTFRTSSGATNF